MKNQVLQTINKVFEINAIYILPWLFSMVLLFVSGVLLISVDEYLFRHFNDWRLLIMIPLLYTLLFLAMKPANYAMRSLVGLIKSLRKDHLHE